jgi:type VI secretion system protein ImpK
MTGRAMQDASERLAGSSIYWCAAPALLLSSQLSTMRLPSPAELRQRLVGVLDRFVSQARSAGLPDADVAEARYALVAFMDDQILKSDWVGRSEWMDQPLQALLYKEYVAGENFYARMRSLLQAPDRVHGLEAYYLCLTMGFSGASNARGESGSKEQFVESARARLAAWFRPSQVVSPHARPVDRAKAQKLVVWPLVLWVAGCVAVALGVWGGLRWSIQRAANDAVLRAPGAASSAR